MIATGRESWIWRDIADAPRDGSRILVVVHATEQWPAEVELVRWGIPPHGADAGWYAADGGANNPLLFSEGELRCWMPLPEPPPY